METVGDIFADVQVWKQSVLLEDGVDAAFIGRKGVEAGAVHPDFAGGGLFEPGDQTKQGGFAGATFTEQGEKFAGGNFERKRFQDFARAEAFADGADFEERCAGRERECDS